NPAGRERRVSIAAPSLPALNEDQKILHLLNRAGFGPRPGDIERVKRMGIEQYLNQQLHPEDISDEFLDKPLQALVTQQMTSPEIAQNYPPPPPKPVPTPTPTPAPKKDAETGGRGDGAMEGQGDGEARRRVNGDMMKQAEKEMTRSGDGKDTAKQADGN